MNKQIEQSLSILIDACDGRQLQEEIAKIEGYILGLEQALTLLKIDKAEKDGNRNR